jgi:CSLREA domain-containing protein
MFIMPKIVFCSKSIILILAIGLISFNMDGQFTVNTVTDTQDSNPGDGLCADAGGNCSLRAAIMESNVLPGDNNVILPIGEYVFSIPGTNENACLTGDLDITGNLTITGENTRQTIIRADSLDRVFDVFPGVVATIEFLEIREGSVIAANGGAIRNQGSLNLSELAIRTSMCEGDGGGQQGGGFGGAIYNAGILDISEVTINSCLALGGKGANGVAPGGGSGGGAGPGMGGAIYNDQGASCTLVNSTISNNKAQGGRGGNGTFHQGSGTVSSAGGNGGGFGGNGGPANGAGISGSWGGGGGGGASLSGAGGAGGFGGGGGGGGANSWGGNAGTAGAAGTYGGTGGQGCCSAGSGGGGGAGLGGGLFNRSVNCEITNCTFAYNEAIGGDGGSGWFSGPGLSGSGKGGALFNHDGTTFLNNTLCAQNSSSTDGPSLFGTFNSDAGHNFVQIADGGMNMIGNTANNLLNQDPFILPLANNGGNTDTHLLESCDPVSPAIDAGNDTYASALDQIGQARINVSEIGALEVLATSVNLLPADTALCLGESLFLDVTSDNSTYTWSDSSTDPTITVDSEGLYSVTVHQNGCDFFDEIQVDYNPLTSIDLGPRHEHLP